MKQLADYIRSIGGVKLNGRLKPWADDILWSQTAYPCSGEAHTIQQYKTAFGVRKGNLKHQTMKAVRWL